MPSQTTAILAPNMKVIPVNKLKRNAEKKNKPAALEWKKWSDKYYNLPIILTMLNLNFVSPLVSLDL